MEDNNQLGHRDGKDDNSSTTSNKKYSDFTLPELTTFWLHYWKLYASIQLLKGLLRATPIISRVGGQLPEVSFSFFAQLELMFFVWALLMDYNWLMQPSEDYVEESWHYLLTHRPPIGLAGYLNSFYIPLYESTSSVVTEEFWDAKVVQKVKSPLDGLVFIRLISAPVRDWVLYTLTHMQSFIVPSITLTMPGFLTQFGVLYVQYVIPNAQASLLLLQHKTKGSSADGEILYLQYWVLHQLVSAWLNYWSSLLWWIPFSTHIIYLMWCYLSFPTTITAIYNEFEKELQAFGLLPKVNKGNKNANDDKDADNISTITAVSLEESRTSKLIRSMINLLPSAKDDNHGTNSTAAATSTSGSVISEAKTGEEASEIRTVDSGSVVIDDNISRLDSRDFDQPQNGTNLVSADDDDDDEHDHDNVQDMSIDSVVVEDNNNNDNASASEEVTTLLSDKINCPEEEEKQIVPGEEELSSPKVSSPTVIVEEGVSNPASDENNNPKATTTSVRRSTRIRNKQQS